ncbi:MAG TPA: hypothetical protein VF834_04420 [Streptosporangiaceae bacterium]
MAYSGGDKPDVAGVLADRLAATLVHHEPGWRLPRPSAIARRYDVRPAQVEQAVRELAARHLIRQLPDGQLYRASPAEFLIPVHGVARLGAHVDPMGGEVTCRSRKISWRRVPEDISWALGAVAAEPVCAVKCHWSMSGDPAAISTTYLTSAVAGEISEPADAAGGLAAVAGDLAQQVLLGGVPQEAGGRAPLGLPAALHLEIQPPPPSIARGLRLSPGQPAAIITMRFDEPDSGRPVALTVAALRADLFRIVVQAADLPAASLAAESADDAVWLSGERPEGPRSAVG